MRIGIVGVGPVGQTLGIIWARAGHEVAVDVDEDRVVARVGDEVVGALSHAATLADGAPVSRGQRALRPKPPGRGVNGRMSFGAASEATGDGGAASRLRI